MTRFHQHRAGRRTGATMSAGLALLAIAAIAPVSANAATCNKTITGVHNGVINVVSPDKLCLHNATQTGAVNVGEGAGLSVLKSKITGAVTLKRGFTELQFCDSKTVTGAISATGAKEAVLIGGTGLLGTVLCAANTIDGAVTLDTNQAGVTLGRNKIPAGAVTASANLNGTTISGNTIGGALTCSANMPAPTNAGVPNAVRGARTGQTCSSSAF